MIREQQMDILLLRKSRGDGKGVCHLMRISDGISLSRGKVRDYVT